MRFSVTCTMTRGFSGYIHRHHNTSTLLACFHVKQLCHPTDAYSFPYKVTMFLDCLFSLASPPNGSITLTSISPNESITLTSISPEWVYHMVLNLRVVLVPRHSMMSAISLEMSSWPCSISRATLHSFIQTLLMS